MEIILNLRNAYLRKYIEYIFEQQDDKFIVSRTSDFGRLCVAHVSRSSGPVNVKKNEFSVTLILPKSNNLPHLSESFYLYYTKFDTHRLNDALLAESNLDFKTYYVTGIECGFMQKDIINSYIDSRRLFADNFDALKKRSYRSAQDSLEKMRRYLSNKIEIMNKKITDKIVVNINNYISNN